MSFLNLPPLNHGVDRSVNTRCKVFLTVINSDPCEVVELNVLGYEGVVVMQSYFKHLRMLLLGWGISDELLWVIDFDVFECETFFRVDDVDHCGVPFIG